MAKRRKKQNKGCAFPLLLALLCLFVGVAYWQPSFEVPESVEQQATVLVQTGGERVEAAKQGISQRLQQLLALLPEDWRDIFGGEEKEQSAEAQQPEEITLNTLPEYAGEPYVILYGSRPDFSEEEQTTAYVYETYSELDWLGRCGVAEALIGTELMPTEEREGIGMVKPSGWQTVRYDDLIEGKYLYNRCHLIGYQLSGENANEMNLITGTRYLNVTGMLPFENQVADYVQETGNRVLYRVTPDFHGLELVARGVQIEALSLEEGGPCFNVYCYNVQPGVEIDYLTGDSHRAEEDG